MYPSPLSGDDVRSRLDQADLAIPKSPTLVLSLLIELRDVTLSMERRGLCDNGRVREPVDGRRGPCGVEPSLWPDNLRIFDVLLEAADEVEGRDGRGAWG